MLKILIFIVLILEVTLYTPTAYAVEARSVSSPFVYTFNSKGILNESPTMEESTSPYFWLNSGGRLILEDNVGKTIQGPLSIGDFWQKLYSTSSSLDTAGGIYPQNLFRLLTRSSWNNVSEEVKFNISKVNLTNTPNRDNYSGILLFSRYKDSDNLYYAGLRQDGTAVIKRKAGGSYTTLASETVFPGTYDKTTNPNLIPTNKWMRLKMETKDLADGKVKITLWLDKTDSGSWTQILSTTDSAGIKGKGYVGIRTDYMDISFDDFKVIAL